MTTGLIICQVPGCSTPGYWEGVCTRHHQQANRAYATTVLTEVGRDLEIEINLDAYYAVDAPSGPIKIAAVPLAWESAGGTPYGRAVLRRLVEKVGACEEGTRNEELNRAAYLAGGYVAGGELEIRVALTALVDAAHAAGLSYREAASTARSGIAKGMRKPLYPRS